MPVKQTPKAAAKKEKTKAAAKREPKKVGRPSLYSEELAARIVDALIAGQSLRKITQEDWCPSMFTILKWLGEKPEFSAQYMRARELQAEAMFEEILDISDEVEVAKVVTEDGQVDLKLDSTAVARNRLRVDARKWALARMAPKRYGDKQVVDVSGKMDVTLFDPDQAARMAQLAYAAKPR